MKFKESQLTLYGAITGDLLGHELAFFVPAVNLHYLLPALLGLGARKGGDCLFAADLAFGRLVVFDVCSGCGRPLGLLEVVPVLLGLLRTKGGIGHPVQLGACLIVGPFVLCILNDLIRVLAQALLRMRLLQKALFVLAGRMSLCLRTCPEITVVNVLKVFGNGVLVVAVHADFLLGPVRVVAILKDEDKTAEILKSVTATKRTSLSCQIKPTSFILYLLS